MKMIDAGNFEIYQRHQIHEIAVCVCVYGVFKHFKSRKHLF